MKARSGAMLPNWLLVVAGFEAMSFLIFGLGIVTAVAEEQVASPAPPNPRAN